MSLIDSNTRGKKNNRKEKYGGEPMGDTRNRLHGSIV